MAWTGAAVVTSLDKNVVRITGVSLAAGASGTIRFTGAGGDISLPLNFPSVPDSDAFARKVTLSSLIEVNYVLDGAGGRAIHVAKSEGPFTITFVNDDGQAGTGTLEIYVQFHHSLHR